MPYLEVIKSIWFNIFPKVCNICDKVKEIRNEPVCECKEDK